MAALCVFLQYEKLFISTTGDKYSTESQLAALDELHSAPRETVLLMSKLNKAATNHEQANSR